MRAVLVLPRDGEHPSRDERARLEHCMARGHTIVGLAPDLEAAVRMVLAGEADVVVAGSEADLSPLVELVQPAEHRPRAVPRPAEPSVSPQWTYGMGRPRPQILDRPG